MRLSSKSTKCGPVVLEQPAARFMTEALDVELWTLFIGVTPPHRMDAAKVATQALEGVAPLEVGGAATVLVEYRKGKAGGVV
jgi:hypothetical protein